MVEQATITRLVIKNFRGIQALEVHPGELNVFAGDNAEGKTSVLDAIAAALRGRVPASAVRHDAKNAEILVELSDGTVIDRKIKADGKSTVKVERDRAVIKSPQGYLDGLFANEGLDPVAFMKSQKERSKVLLEALPIKTSIDEVRDYLEQAGLAVSDVKGLKTESVHAFEVFEAVRKRLYDERRDVNKDAKRLKEWLDEERSRLQSVADPTVRLDEVLSTIGEMKMRVETEREQKEAIERAELRKHNAINGLRDMQERLADTQQRIEEAQNEIKEIDEWLAGKSDTAQENLGDKLGLLEDEADHLREARALWEASRRRVGELDAKQQELEGMQARSEALTAGVNVFAKDAPADALLKTDLPVDGLKYRDGAFYWNDTHIDQLSGKETLVLAAQLTRQLVRGQRLAVLCLDGFEAIGPNHLQTFFDEIRGDGLQYWLAWVNHGQNPPEGEDVLYLILEDGQPANQPTKTGARPAPEVDPQAGMLF